MDILELKELLDQKAFQLNWYVCPFNDKKCFYSSMMTSPSQIVLCFVPSLDDKPCLATLSTIDLQTQCRNQGFVDESIRQIQLEVQSQTNKSSFPSFQRDDDTIKFSIAVSSTISVLLRATVAQSDEKVSITILQRLLHDVIRGAYFQREFSDSLVNQLQEKDRAIGYLKDNLEELGGNKMLARWAPKGSINSRALKKYDCSKGFQGFVENTDEDTFKEENAMEAAGPLFALQRELKHPSISNPNSPMRRKRRTSAADFSPFQEETAKRSKIETNQFSNDSVGGKSVSAPSLKEPLKPTQHSPTSSRGSSESPSKKRRFGKIKITKE